MYIALGGAQLPEELLTAIFFRKLGPQYVQAKNAIMNMAKLKTGAFPTTRGELASIVDGYKVYVPDDAVQQQKQKQQQDQQHPTYKQPVWQDIFNFF